MWIIPLLATIISLFFALVLTQKYRETRKVHNLLYAISLYMFTIAAFGEFYSTAFGWTIWMYKIYYFPAITLVPVMAGGTIYIMANRWVNYVYLGYVGILSLLLLIQLIPAEVNTNLLFSADYAVGGEGMPDEVRRYSFWLSGVGGILLLVGSLYSWWRNRHKGFLYIAAGALIMSFGGRLAKMGLTAFLPLSELLGIIVLFYGVILLDMYRSEGDPEKKSMFSGISFSKNLIPKGLVPRQGEKSKDHNPKDEKPKEG
ncbi:hypothetical protein L1765_08840 [Microaerobacter geothermalis]|uniref:hypothetical protein n=1 Tax=Microaerobacter geothermalis TaxID=674972 RepID=UPI001F3E1461|nr:hypothetical protein [Microaerobacter geothermalis]MCF6094066.1 hypothetical protein [Microaerobacter geothermalis]